MSTASLDNDGGTLVHGNGQVFHDDRVNVAGHSNTLHGLRCRVSGNGNVVHGARCQVNGSGNTVTGDYGVVVGDGNIVSGNGCMVRGIGNVISGQRCIVNGGLHESQGGEQNNHQPPAVVDLTHTRQAMDTEENDDDMLSTSSSSGSSDSSSSSSSSSSSDSSLSSSSSSSSSLNIIPLRNRVTGSSSSANPMSSRRHVAHPTESDVTLDSRAEDPPKNTCIICHEKKAVCVAFPCMHMSYCSLCARSHCIQNGTAKNKGSVNCAKCRHPVDGIKRVFVE